MNHGERLVVEVTRSRPSPQFGGQPVVTLPRRQGPERADEPITEPIEPLREQIVRNQQTIDRLNRDLARVSNEVRIIQQISREITSTLDLDEVLAIVLGAMERVLGFEHSMIFLTDAAGNRLRLAASRGYQPSGVGAEVAVGEGPGHVRDSEQALLESGVMEALDALGLAFRDLNYEEVAWTANRGGKCKLGGFFFPRSVAEADLVVSMPKMKTHHWVGVTAAMKNLYGCIPGIKYGWPKNVLHHNGIPETVHDINASLPKTIAIVDGIDCMEGDGPILGTLKPMGLVVVGTNPAAVDATICRLMDLEPAEVPYLALAAHSLGLGAGVVTSFSRAGAKEILNLPDGWSAELLVCLGHPAPSQPPGMRSAGPRVTWQSLTSWERFTGAGTRA